MYKVILFGLSMFKILVNEMVMISKFNVFIFLVNCNMFMIVNKFLVRIKNENIYIMIIIIM